MATRTSCVDGPTTRLSGRLRSKNTWTRSTARSASTALASGGSHRGLSQGQRRDVPRHRQPQPAAPRTWRPGMDWDAIGALDPTSSTLPSRALISAGSSRRPRRDGGRPGAALPDWLPRLFLVRDRMSLCAAAPTTNWIADSAKRGGAAVRPASAATEYGFRPRGLQRDSAHSVSPSRLLSGNSFLGRPLFNLIPITTRYGPSWNGWITARCTRRRGCEPGMTSHGPFFEKIKDRSSSRSRRAGAVGRSPA